MPKTKKATDPKKKRARKSPRSALIAKLLRVSYLLGKLLVSKYATAGIEAEMKGAQELVVHAGQSLPEDWSPKPKRAKKVPTPEQLKQLEERAKKAMERLDAAKAAAEAGR